MDFFRRWLPLEHCLEVGLVGAVNLETKCRADFGGCPRSSVGSDRVAGQTMARHREGRRLGEGVICG